MSLLHLLYFVLDLYDWTLQYAEVIVLMLNSLKLLFLELSQTKLEYINIWYFRLYLIMMIYS